LLFLTLLVFIPLTSFAQLSDVNPVAISDATYATTDPLSEHTFESSIDEGGVYVIIQIQIRDSDDSLVGYIETDRITVTNLPQLFDILDDMSTNSDDTKIIFIDDKKYQVITGIGDAKYTSDTIASMSLITKAGEPILFANYDGIPIRAGDSIISTWTMVRLV